MKGKYLNQLKDLKELSPDKMREIKAGAHSLEMERRERILNMRLTPITEPQIVTL